jgi:hypothetical protein
MSKTIFLASVFGAALAGAVFAQGATGGGGSGGGGGAVVESPQPGQSTTPAGMSANTPGMATPSATVANHAQRTTKPANSAGAKKGSTTSYNEPPPNRVRPVAAGVSSNGSK